MSLSKLLQEYQRLHDEQEITGSKLQSQEFKLVNHRHGNSSPLPNVATTEKYLRNRIEANKRKYRLQRERSQKALQSLKDAVEKNRRKSAAIELAKRDVAEVARRYEPTTPVNGYRNTLGDWIS